jgi:predicted enzyme related to lactoylglutathione lyase
MGDPVVHFEILGKDGQGLQDFYSGIFGWKIDSSNPANYGIVDTESGDRGIPGGVSAAERGAGWITFYIEVDDLEGTMTRIEEAGGKALAGPMQVPGGPRLAIFADPEGHTVGLVDGATSNR